MSKPSPLTWTPHPVLAIPSREQVQALIAAKGPEQAKAELAAYHRQREEKIRLEAHDPLRHGYDGPMYHKLKALLEDYDEVLVMGGNRLGKTRDAIKLLTERQVANPNRLVTAFDRSEKASINKQHPVFHQMIPPEWRDLGKQGNLVNVKWTKATGFSNAQYILPNASQTMFFNYKQDVNDFEGYEIDDAYFDELVPLPFYEAMTFRLGKGRPLKIIITFTPLENGGPAYTPVVQKFLGGATILETAPVAPQMHEMIPPDQVHAKGCPPGHLPVLMQCSNPKACVLFYHWGCNLFGANDEVLARLHGRPKAQWLVRAYGWVDKPAGAALARYGKAHRITREQYETIAKRGGSRYCVIDPGGTKNWFIKWYFCTPEGWTIVYREWPDAQRFGPWAIPPEKIDKPAWRPGEAQRLEAGRGIDAYKQLMLELEGWRWDEKQGQWDGSKSETITGRLIDPRMGGGSVPGQDEGTSIIGLLSNETKNSAGRVTLPPMYFEKAPGRHEQHGIQELQSAMEYDESRPIEAHDNCPSWYVVDDLAQTHLAYSEYTGLGGEKDALKDIIDPDRYFVEKGYGFIDELAMQPRGGTYF